MTTSAALSFGTPQARWVIAATVLGSGMTFLDATVVNIALPTLGDDLHAGVAGLQWTVNGYALTLASLILLGGSLGDRFGRRRMFVVGVVWFAIASALCALAPTVGVLVAARALQGVGGALLTPGSLAILQSSFALGDRARAIGAWSGMGGLAGALGPFVGGWLIEQASWRWVFWLNLPVAAVVVLLTARHVPESRDPQASPHLDVPGAISGALALAALTYGLVRAGDTFDAITLLALGVALVAGTGFVLVERRSPAPMLPLDVFASAQFRAVNAATFLMYAALGGLLFMLVLALQVVVGFSPLAAGASMLPVTAMMLALSARSGALASRIGPRLQLTTGPLVAAVGLLLLTRVDVGASYLADVLPGVLVFGAGLVFTVAPLTATALSAAEDRHAEDRHAGVASGVNNAVARAGGLVMVAALPALIGLSGSYADAAALRPSYVAAMVWCAGLLASAGVLAGVSIRNQPPRDVVAVRAV